MWGATVIIMLLGAEGSPKETHREHEIAAILHILLSILLQVVDAILANDKLHLRSIVFIRPDLRMHLPPDIVMSFFLHSF